MGTRDPRVDAYIAKSAPFARPILDHLREVVHATCPDVEEAMKWSFPHFMYHGMMCAMSAFKQHCAFGFWKGALIVADAKNDEAMGQFGRIASLADLPPRRTIEAYVRRAMKLNAENVKPPRTTKDAQPKPPVALPDDLRAALAKNKKAAATYEGFSPSGRREYVEWITEAKRAETREKRVLQAVEWMAEGKQRNWKYQPG